MWECSSYSLTMRVIELNSRRYPIGQPEVECSIAARDYFSFTVRKQTLINSTSPMLAKDPQIADPLAIRPHRPDDLGSQYGDPRKMPPCSSTGSSDGVQSPPLISSTTV